MDDEIKELGAVLDELSGQVPKLLSGIVNAIYSEEAGRNIGKSVGAMYSELVSAGMPKEDALELAKNYMLSMKSVIGDDQKDGDGK